MIDLPNECCFCKKEFCKLSPVSQSSCRFITPGTEDYDAILLKHAGQVIDTRQLIPIIDIRQLIQEFCISKQDKYRIESKFINRFLCSKCLNAFKNEIYKVLEKYNLGN